MRTQQLWAGAVLAIVLVFTMLAGGVSAHHSMAGFESDESKAIVLKGSVSEFRWRNPHVLIFWDVKDANGKVVTWVGELGSVASSMAGGWTKDTLKAGDEITVTAMPSKAGTPQSLIRRIVKADGTELR